MKYTYYMKMVIVCIIIFLKSFIIFGQSENESFSYSENKQEILADGDINFKGGILSFFSGKLKIHLYLHDGVIDSLSFFAQVAHKKILNTSNIEELKKGKIESMSLGDSESILAYIIPRDFQNDGGIIKFKLNTLKNGIKEDFLYIKKDTKENFSLYLIENNSFKKITKIHLTLRGSIFKLNKIQIYSYTFEHTTEI